MLAAPLPTTVTSLRRHRLPASLTLMSAEMGAGRPLFRLGGAYHHGGTNSCEFGGEGPIRRLCGVFGTPDCYRQEVKIVQQLQR